VAVLEPLLLVEPRFRLVPVVSSAVPLVLVPLWLLLQVPLPFLLVVPVLLPWAVRFLLRFLREVVVLLLLL